MNSTPKIGIVVPTIREESIQRFLKEWESEFSAYPNLRIFIMEDNPEKSFKLESKRITHLCWQDIEEDLGENSWIIPRRTDCVRSYGYYRAYKEGIDILLTMDDDCYPMKKEPYLLKEYIDNFNLKIGTEFFNTLDGRLTNSKNIYPRGFPYDIRNKEVFLCHGLWENVPDFDGITQLQHPDLRVNIAETDISTVPKGILFPMCGMNVAIRREAIPAFYFLLMGKNNKEEDFGIDRFGDIWCGFFIKKIIDHLDKSAVSGRPIIFHDRASDAEVNKRKEAPGLPLNEDLWDTVMNIELSSDNFKDCYIELAEKLPAPTEYFEKLKKAMKVWGSLF
ncbi:MAG: hypothetical protein HQ536_03390 [Parcubacteria group bacterium]|nr:hypothetical protein [Parcubacteria group bacterium]